MTKGSITKREKPASKNKKASTLNVIISGSTGRVGGELLAICSENSALTLAGEINHSLGMPKSLKGDVVVDFSAPDAFDKLLKLCVASKIPLVSGTTGLSQEQFKKMKEASKQIPICWASNMSVGVAFVKKLLKLFGDLDGFDFQIEEIHHRHKKDAPSGTAITLQEVLKSAVKEKVPEPLSLRGGGVFGVHKVWAFSEEEVISVEHQALNRRVFAQGALKAAAWIKNKKPGLYNMDDVLGS